MENAESWEDYELQLACWSMLSKPLLQVSLGMSQHMCSIPLLHQGPCSPFLRLLWSELQDGFTTSDPHIDSHHFGCLFHCATAFCTSNLAINLGWLKHGWFCLDTFDMIRDDCPRESLGTSAGLASRRPLGDVRETLDSFQFLFGHGMLFERPCVGFICFETIKQRTSRPWPTTTTDGHSNDGSHKAIFAKRKCKPAENVSFLCRVRQHQWYVSSWWTIPATLLSLFWLRRFEKSCLVVDGQVERYACNKH